MPDEIAQIRRELDMARADLQAHAKTLSDFTVRLRDIADWQTKKDIADARQEEREKVMVQQLSGIFKVGWAILGVLITGFGAAFVTFIVRGGLYIAS